MKISKKTIIVTILFTLLPSVAGLFLWNRLPAQIPTHFDFNNQVNGWSSKATVVFGLPAFMAMMQLVLVFAFKYDPKKENIGRKLQMLTMWVIPVSSLITISSSYGIALGIPINISMVVNIFVGCLFIGLGNYLPKSKQSYTMGLKMPWTLNSEENWNRTHRLAGWLWMFGGIAYLINGFLGSSILFAIIILTITLVPAGYSFLLYRKGV